MADTQDADLIELLNSLDIHNQHEHGHQFLRESKIYIDNQGKLKDPFLEDVQQKIKDPRSSLNLPSSAQSKSIHAKSTPMYVQPTIASQLNSSLRRSAELRIPVDQFDGDDFVDHEPLHSGTKVKSLSLRLTGQMRTIRALESQLVQYSAQIAEKDRMLRSMQNRIRFLETKSATSKPQYAPPLQPDVSKTKILSKINDKLASQYETQVRTLEARLGEEQSRRMKAEERSRTFKEYLDKLKISHSEYESRNMSLEKVVSDLQNKLARQRKEHRELAAELESMQLSAHNHRVELEAQRRQSAQADASLRSALQEIDSLREELRFYKTDAAASKSSLQAALSESDSLRGRLKGQSKASRMNTKYEDAEPPVSQPATYPFAQAVPEDLFHGTTRRATDYYSDAPPVRQPATRQQISARASGQRLSSVSDSEAFVKKPMPGSTHRGGAYPYDGAVRRHHSIGQHGPREDARSKVHNRPLNHRYNDGMSMESDVDTAGSSLYGYDEAAAVLSARPQERSRRNTSTSSVGSTTLKYDRLKSMYKRVTGKDISRLEYASQYPDSDDD